MKKELYEKEINYALSLTFLKGLRQSRLLTAEEFRNAQLKLKTRYKPFLRYKLENIA